MLIRSRGGRAQGLQPQRQLLRHQTGRSRPVHQGGQVDRGLLVHHRQNAAVTRIHYHDGTVVLAERVDRRPPDVQILAIDIVAVRRICISRARPRAAGDDRTRHNHRVRSQYRPLHARRHPAHRSAGRSTQRPNTRSFHACRWCVGLVRRCVGSVSRHRPPMSPRRNGCANANRSKQMDCKSEYE